MRALAAGLSYCDLHFRGHERVVATAVLDGPGGVTLVDPGPSTTLPTLDATLDRAGRSPLDVTTIVLTHIHLDHAGAVGTLVRRRPGTRVYLHKTGVPHLVDPTRLVASATRLYQDRMAEHWGEVAPVPAEALVPLEGGEQIDVSGHRLDAAYTPGHASHHLSFFHATSRVAFVGDTAGIKRRPGGYELAPTPPPDIDLDLWRESLATIDRWNADTLFLTHFGPSSPARVHLAVFADHLEWLGGLARVALGQGDTEEAREAWFGDRLRDELRKRMGEAEVLEYEIAGRFDLSYRGLARYWRKKASG